MSRMTAAVVAAILAAPAALADSLGTAFTYQGSLSDNGAPASGTYDLRFSLFTIASGGSAAGTPLCADNVAVVNGLFTVQLDFGPMFRGDLLYLEVEVRPDAGQNCTNAACFTVLTPRQALTAAPNAAFALTAALATDAGTVEGLSASFLRNASNINAGTLADNRLTSNIARLNAAQTFTAIPSFNGGTSGLTAPFVVDSATKVTNLNEDLLEGLDSSAFTYRAGAGLNLNSNTFE